MKETMTTKERWLAAIQMQPVDRLPFWPKLDAAYPPMQSAPFRSMQLDEIHAWMGSDNHIGVADCTREVFSNTSVETTHTNGTMTTTYRTKRKDMRLVQKFDVPSQAWYPIEYPIHSVEDVCSMIEIFEDTEFVLDQDRLETAKEQVSAIGQTALTTNEIGESPLMFWVEYLAGMENAHFLLSDHQPEVEELFEAMHRVLIQKAELLCAYSVADVLYMRENTSTTLISPDQYHKYCKEHVGGYAQICLEADRPLILHMCGHLKALLPDLAELPARAFEAFTSPTVGNTTLLDGRRACPSTCLIGGTNATLWLQPAGDIIAAIEHDLDQLSHHRGIVVTSAGVMPPFCKPDTISQVCAWVKQYPARMN